MISIFIPFNIEGSSIMKIFNSIVYLSMIMFSSRQGWLPRHDHARQAEGPQEVPDSCA